MLLCRSLGVDRVEMLSDSLRKKMVFPLFHRRMSRAILQIVGAPFGP